MIVVVFKYLNMLLLLHISGVTLKELCTRVSSRSITTQFLP